MWILKFKSKEEFNIYNKRTIKFNIRIHFYSQKYYIEKNNIYFINSGIVFGEEDNKNLFFKDLQKDKKIKEIEINNDFFVSVYYEKVTEARVSALKTIYNQKIIFLKPTLFDEKGFEEWEVASFNRTDLEDILKQGKKLQKTIGGEFKLLSFKEKKVKDLTMQSIMPNLSTQQKKALELAIQNKYYGYPRKITLKKLAAMMKISESTYQFHLAKAEEKIIPFFSKK
ncbi:MAG: helix-turn-helix domain-containing protein [Nanoarchaeota archaeon]|nr:helix-turn-helix domain-containing protein [Nanoarchaeota archaeon]MBU1320765.1 helix-turn-helix domain-containing protein [Nanoarchaeota archaeon]MBU1598132.1 helix-turn-helix domain-containing protein [Nanoarchaeota archaeon]